MPPVCVYSFGHVADRMTDVKRLWIIPVMLMLANAVIGVGRRDLTFHMHTHSASHDHIHDHAHSHDHDHAQHVHDHGASTCDTQAGCGDHEHKPTRSEDESDGWHLHLVHDNHCCCEDVVVPVFGLLVLLKVETTDRVFLPLTVAYTSSDECLAPPRAPRVGQRSMLFDPGGDRSIALVRSTRLNV